ncbi:MAG: hypothetical protein CVU22_19070 [Betaproteobacteria bacterium HGW-Betaproteobacteria-16]|nr:MAG: hypothetical protein CVU22_19070 [Betaproteobacteria bacterium HGW-Betaproteobacteria-16]
MKQPTHTAPPAGAFDPTRCPLCGGDNRCAMEIEHATGMPQPPCWCVAATFSPELMARLPAESAGKACICPNCVACFAAEAQAHAAGDQ